MRGHLLTCCPLVCNDLLVALTFSFVTVMCLLACHFSCTYCLVFVEHLKSVKVYLNQDFGEILVLIFSRFFFFLPYSLFSFCDCNYMYVRLYVFEALFVLYIYVFSVFVLFGGFGWFEFIFTPFPFCPLHYFVNSIKWFFKKFQVVFSSF